MILSLSIFFISYILISSAIWVIRKFGQVTYEQIVFHLNMPLDAEIKLIYSYFQNTFLMASIITVVLFYLIKKKIIVKHLILSILFFVCSIAMSCYKLNISNMIKEYNNKSEISKFYEQHYVDANNTIIKSPINKRNLILIFAESMESTYANNEYFGDNLIPELHQLAQDNISFSHTNDFGGFYTINGAKYTQASLISQLCAIPLKLPIDVKRFRPKNGFLPGATCLFDILDKDGYNQSFMIGTTREYAGTDKYLETHSNPKILDWIFYSKRDNLDDDSDPKRKRIIRDEKLFSYAKSEIIDLYQKEKPFAFVMMTLDTHFGNEHFDKENCIVKYHDDNIKDEDFFKNVISCSSFKINNFVNWIKSQPFFANTEVVIVGDHLTMGGTISDNIKDRAVYNAYINSSIKDKSFTKNRKFTALDTMPTILEGLGYNIKGHQIGLGVSLFSGKPTLLEENISIEELNKELDMQSEVYNKILYGKDKL